MQHLVVQTSSSDGLEANTGWYRNAAGLEYNHRFGFGVIKANKLVEAALKFSHVDHQETCETSFE